MVIIFPCQGKDGGSTPLTRSCMKIYQPKNIFFPAVILIGSFYFSIILGLGIISGYFFANFFLSEPINQGRLKSLIFKFGKWNFHLHHWLLGALIFLGLYFSNLIGFIHIFFLGALGGVILEDLHLDEKRFKVLYRE